MPDGTTGRALITGASSGLGAAFAGLLSERGYEVILTGRDLVRLQSVAGSLPGPSRVVVADLSRPAELATVEALLADTDAPVDLLVNNAAAGWHGPFAQHDPALLDETVALNITAPIRLARAVLPVMVARGRGGVINVSSVAGSSPSPRMAAYAATKSFVDSWTAAVTSELRGTGVILTCVKPGYVRTDFHVRSGEAVDRVRDTDWMSPTYVAQRALDAHVRGRTSAVILPDVPPLQRLARWSAGRARRAPWLRGTRAALRSVLRPG